MLHGTLQITDDFLVTIICYGMLRGTLQITDVFSPFAFSFEQEVVWVKGLPRCSLHVPDLWNVLWYFKKSLFQVFTCNLFQKSLFQVTVLTNLDYQLLRFSECVFGIGQNMEVNMVMIKYLNIQINGICLNTCISSILGSTLFDTMFSVTWICDLVSF